MIEDFLGRTGLRIVSGLLILLAIVLLSYLFLRSYELHTPMNLYRSHSFSAP